MTAARTTIESDLQKQMMQYYDDVDELMSLAEALFCAAWAAAIVVLFF